LPRNRQQLSLFGDDQPELFAEDAPPRQYRGDPDRVRARLLRILAEARAAATMPWNSDDLGYYQTIFPQMTNWLPEDEAAQLRFAFEAELERLGAA